MVPVERIGLSTSPLPRERSTTEPHRQDSISLLELSLNVKYNFIIFEKIPLKLTNIRFYGIMYTVV